MFLERDILFQLFRELSNNICSIDKNKRMSYHYDHETGFSVFFFYGLRRLGWLDPSSMNTESHLNEIKKEIVEYTKKHQIFNRIHLTVIERDSNFYKITIGLKNRNEKEQEITYGLGLIEGVIKPKAISK